MRKPKKYAPKHWGISEAAMEFDRDHETLKKALLRAGITPAFQGGKFSTAQIVSALFGDIDGEKLRLTKAQADRYEILNRVADDELIDKEEMLGVMSRGLAAMVACVQGMTELSQDQRDQIIVKIREAGAATVQHKSEKK